MWTYNYSNELYHYGILGMKWGKRRYQNKDGTYTNAGKKRRKKDLTGPGEVKSAKQKMKLVAKKTEEVKNTTTYKNGKYVVEEIMKTNGRRSSTYARVTIKEDDNTTSTWRMSDVEAAKRFVSTRGR